MFLFLINIIKKNLFLSIFLGIAILLTIFLFFFEAFKKELILTNTIPLSGQTVYDIDNRSPIICSFSEAVDEKTIKITSSPSLEFKFEVDNSSFQIKIFPIPAWEYNENYKITIDKNLSSLTGARLKKDLIFNFLIKFPPLEELPPPVGPGHGF